MTKEKQRIVIAEFCGAKYVQFLGKKAWTFESYHNPENLLCPMEHGECLIDVPNYPEDLNAMHKAEELLHGGKRVYYIHNLGRVMGNIDLIFTAYATAAQRSEAFVKTIGRWEE